jgi:pantoate--beta-alanine ligase
VRPHKPQVFGRKDYQQFMVLSRMVRDLDFGIKMIGAPLVREADGLALSSRNVRLTPENRIKALTISAALRTAAEEYKSAAVTDSSVARHKIMKAISEAGGVVDYVEIVAQSTLTAVPTLGVVPSVILVAAKFGSVRLLDNWEFP